MIITVKKNSKETADSVRMNWGLSAKEAEEFRACLRDRVVTLSARELLINIGQHDIRARLL